MQEEVLKSEHDRVVSYIRDQFQKRYKVLTNLDDERNYIANIFPDLILINNETDKPDFIIEVKKNGSIAPCLQQWKSLPSIPATLYIVVPVSDLKTAQSVAQVVGLQMRFGTYQIDENNNLTVTYD